MRVKRMLSLCLALLFLFCVQTPIQAEPLKHRVFYHGSREEKVIALTFDDGPHPRYTTEILAILEKYQVRATFFVIGKNLELYPTAARALLQSDNEIGNHTYSHPHMQYISTENLMEEINKTEEIIASLGGKPTTLFRPPDGAKSASHLTVVSHLSYKTVLWSIDTKDWAHHSPSSICKTVLKNVKGGDIVLFHDYVNPPSYTITALEYLIPMLLQNGYRFVTVSELLGQCSSSGEESSS